MNKLNRAVVAIIALGLTGAANAALYEVNIGGTYNGSNAVPALGGLMPGDSINLSFRVEDSTLPSGSPPFTPNVFFPDAASDILLSSSTFSASGNSAGISLQLSENERGVETLFAIFGSVSIDSPTPDSATLGLTFFGLPAPFPQSTNQLYDGTELPGAVANIEATWDQGDVLDASPDPVIRFQLTGLGGSNGVPAFDISSLDVELVPEPSSLALLTIGGLSLLRRRRS